MAQVAIIKVERIIIGVCDGADGRPEAWCNLRIRLASGVEDWAKAGPWQAESRYAAGGLAQRWAHKNLPGVAVCGFGLT